MYFFTKIITGVLKYKGPTTIFWGLVHGLPLNMKCAYCQDLKFCDQQTDRQTYFLHIRLFCHFIGARKSHLTLGGCKMGLVL